MSQHEASIWSVHARNPDDAGYAVPKAERHAGGLAQGPQPGAAKADLLRHEDKGEPARGLSIGTRPRNPPLLSAWQARLASAGVGHAR
jgi:hypothetical protein